MNMIGPEVWRAKNRPSQKAFSLGIALVVLMGLPFKALSQSQNPLVQHGSSSGSQMAYLFPQLGTGQQTGSQASAQGLVKQIIIQGNKVLSSTGILASMQTKVGLPFHQSMLDQDADTLYGLGEFKSKPLITAVHNPDGTFTVTVEVVENPVIKEIRVVGNTVISTRDILKVITIKPGQLFTTRDQAISSDNIQKLYESKGYFAQIADFSYLQESPETLNIQIQELTVGSIKFPGNIKTKKRVFDHLIHTKVGQTYNSQEWRADMTRLVNTGWFSKVEPHEAFDSNQPQIDLSANLTEGRSGNFNVGLQVDPQSSIAGFVSLTESNLEGTGQSVGASFTQGISGGGPSVDLSYGNPFIDSMNTALNVSLYSSVIYRFSGNLFGGSDLPTNTNAYIERHTGGSVAFNRPVNDHVNLSLSTRIEQVTTSNLNTSLNNQFIQQDGTIATTALGLEINRRDINTNASRGDYLLLTAEPGYADITNVGGLFTGPTYLGRSTFYKFQADYRAYFSPGQPPRPLDNLNAPRKVIAFRLQAGIISGKVPFFEQFFAGGSDTIRGYPQDRFWGTDFLSSTLEYRYPIQKAFSLIGFVDYGGAWGGYGSVNNFYQTNFFRLHLGTGIGASFQTPLGPIRIDLGFNEHGGSRTDFQIGTSF